MSSRVREQEPVLFRAPQHMFVYGSLKKDFSNHSLLSRNSAFFCGEYLTKAASFEMRSYGGFPCVLNVDKGGKKVMGELYLCTPSLIEAMDKMEGHPFWYKRKRVWMDDGTWAHTYIMPKEGVHDLPLVDTIQTDNGEAYQWKEREVEYVSV